MSDEILSPSNEGNFSGSVHTSTSNIISYSIYAATACLAFFFLFAAALFSGYMLAYSTFGVVVKSTGSVIGRIVSHWHMRSSNCFQHLVLPSCSHIPQLF